LNASESHEDAAVGLRATKYAKSWQDTLDGMEIGRIKLGSRVPVSGFPSWVTLHVNYGGFASGKAVAGELGKDERAMLVKNMGSIQTPGHPQDTEWVWERNDDTERKIRSKLFSHYLSDADLDELYSTLEEWRLHCPRS
jgi:hypothetical protein